MEEYCASLHRVMVKLKREEERGRSGEGEGKGERKSEGEGERERQDKRIPCFSQVCTQDSRRTHRSPLGD